MRGALMACWTMYNLRRFSTQIRTQSYVAYPNVVGTDADTTAWVSAVIANGGTVSGGRQTIVNALIVGLKADGIWTKLDRLWLFAAEDQPSALTDLVALALATASGGPTFTVDMGYTENGVTSYIETNYQPNGSGNYTLNAAQLSVWCTTAGSATTAAHAVSDNGGGHIFPIFSDGNSYFRVNANAGGGVGNGARAGFYTANRSGASALEGYKDGTQVTTNASAASGLPSFTFTFGGIGGAPGVDDVAAGAFGGSLSVGEAGDLYTRLRTYMTAVGVP
jgi:hypothetical protein